MKMEGENRLSAIWGGAPVNPATIAFRIDVSVEPQSDVAEVERVEVTFDGQPLLLVKGELDGIAAAVAAFAGDALVVALGTSIGLVDKKRTGSANVSIDRVWLPLDHFEPWAKMFLPDLEM